MCAAPHDVANSRDVVSIRTGQRTRVALVDELGGVQSSIQACPPFENGYQHRRRIHLAAGGGEIFSGKHLQSCIVLHAW